MTGQGTAGRRGLQGGFAAQPQGGQAAEDKIQEASEAIARLVRS